MQQYAWTIEYIEAVKGKEINKKNTEKVRSFKLIVDQRFCHIIEQQIILSEINFKKSAKKYPIYWLVIMSDHKSN